MRKKEFLQNIAAIVKKKYASGKWQKRPTKLRLKPVSVYRSRIMKSKGKKRKVTKPTPLVQVISLISPIPAPSVPSHSILSPADPSPAPVPIFLRVLGLYGWVFNETTL